MPAERLRPEINVTPLVDVVLVLLIICMVVTPQMDGPSVDLPAARHTDAEEKVKLTTLTVGVTAAGVFFVGPDLVAADAIDARLRAAREGNARLKVVLKADRAVAFGEVRRLFALCREIGFAGVALKVGDGAPAEG